MARTPEEWLAYLEESYESASIGKRMIRGRMVEPPELAQIRAEMEYWQRQIARQSRPGAFGVAVVQRPN